MHRNPWEERDWDPQRWYLVPVRPGTIVTLQRWGVVCISLLALLVLGFLLIAVVPQKASSAAPGPNLTNPATSTIH
jgi:hypothetical protein